MCVGVLYATNWLYVMCDIRTACTHACCGFVLCATLELLAHMPVVLGVGSSLLKLKLESPDFASGHIANNGDRWQE